MATKKKTMKQPLIKPENKGKFTKKAKEHGESVSKYAKEVLQEGSKASATTKKEANFARNAKKWNHSKKGK